MWDNLDHITESELEELKKSFYAEAYEIVEKLQDSLLQIEEHRDDKDLLTAPTNWQVMSCRDWFNGCSAPLPKTAGLRSWRLAGRSTS